MLDIDIDSPGGLSLRLGATGEIKLIQGSMRCFFVDPPMELPALLVDALSDMSSPSLPLLPDAGEARFISGTTPLLLSGKSSAGAPSKALRLVGLLIETSNGDPKSSSLASERPPGDAMLIESSFAKLRFIGDAAIGGTATRPLLCRTGDMRLDVEALGEAAPRAATLRREDAARGEPGGEAMPSRFLSAERPGEVDPLY